jgi:hypothetical protein
MARCTDWVCPWTSRCSRYPGQRAWQARTSLESGSRCATIRPGPLTGSGRADACCGETGNRVAAGQRHGTAAPRRRRGGRRFRRCSDRGRCLRDCDGALVSARGAMALASARVRAKGHSLVTEAAIPSAALFLEYEEATGSILSPEIFPVPMAPCMCVQSRATLPPGRSWSRACGQLTGFGRWCRRHAGGAGESQLPHSAVNRRHVLCCRFRRGGFFDS